MGKKTHVNKGKNNVILVPVEDVPHYLTLGWVVGSFKKCDMGNRVWMNDGTTNKRVLKKEVKSFKKAGWKEGRTAEYGRKMADKKWLNLNGKDRRIPTDELDNHPIPPWAKGRTYRHSEETRQKIKDAQAKHRELKEKNDIK